MDASSLITMFDSTDPGCIPGDAQAAAAYNDLRYAASWPALIARFPGPYEAGRLVSIAALPSTRARIYDLEPGNPMSVAQLPGAVKASIAAGIYRPGVYASEPLLSQCRAALLASGLQPDEFCCWLADWDGVSEIPPGDAAKQIRNAGPYDISVCDPDFFPPPPVPGPHGVAHVLLSLDLASGRWSEHALPGAVHWGEQEQWDSVEVQLCRGGQRRGEWRWRSLPYNAPPLGD
jgi:hypothetical protein